MHWDINFDINNFHMHVLCIIPFVVLVYDNNYYIYSHLPRNAWS